jgi:hypothetical protein
MTTTPRMDNQFFSLHMLITGRYTEQPFRSYMDDLAAALADAELDAEEVPRVIAPYFPRY